MEPLDYSTLKRLGKAVDFNPAGLAGEDIKRLPEDLQPFVLLVQDLTKQMQHAGIPFRATLTFEE